MSGVHDRFVRYTFSQPERAAAELRAALPSHVVSAVDWSSLQRESGSVVDPELRHTETDLLFTARLRTGRSLLLYVLLEHQSTVDRWMALRMLRYVVRQLEHWRQQHPESALLPVIIPLVMYHGPEGAWTAPRRVEDLFELPDEEEQRERWRALVQAGPEGTEHLVVLSRYLVWIGDKAVHEAAKRVLHSVLDEQRSEELMGSYRSYGEELIEEGLRRGRAEYILRILSARGVQVDDSARQRILTCTDVATLDRWFDRALNATTLREVLEDLAQ